jgi:hypothetical protein
MLVSLYADTDFVAVFYSSMYYSYLAILLLHCNKRILVVLCCCVFVVMKLVIGVIGQS